MSRWHPLLTHQEPSPGRWELLDADGAVYGMVEIIRRGDETGYRAVTTGRAGGRPTYWRTLRAAVEQVHAEWVGDHAPRGGVNGQ